MDDSDPFGKKDSFKAIHDSFIQSEDYKKSLEKLDENITKHGENFQIYFMIIHFYVLLKIGKLLH